MPLDVSLILPAKYHLTHIPVGVDVLSTVPLRSGGSIAFATVGKQFFIAGLLEGSTALSKKRLKGQLTFCKRDGKYFCENTFGKICVIER